MTLGVVSALALGAGAPVVVVAAGLLAAAQPVAAGIAAGAWWAVSRRLARDSATVDHEAAFLAGLAAELGAGAAPRAALVAAAERAPRLDLSRATRLAESGMSAERVAAALETALPTHGAAAAAAWAMAAGVGGPVAAMFDTLAIRAADDGVLQRERRALTAQARASAAVVAGLPVLLVTAMAVTGRLRIGSDPALTAILAAGLLLQASGLLVVWRMLRGVS